jgi:hypothetical protein
MQCKKKVDKAVETVAPSIDPSLNVKRDVHIAVRRYLENAKSKWRVSTEFRLQYMCRC